MIRLNMNHKFIAWVGGDKGLFGGDLKFPDAMSRTFVK